MESILSICMPTSRGRERDYKYIVGQQSLSSLVLFLSLKHLSRNRGKNKKR